MSKDIHVVREVLCGHAQGLSLDRIRLVTGVPKTSVKRIVDRARATGFTVEELLAMPDEAVVDLLMPTRRARMNYVEPDWEDIYLQCERPRKPLRLQICWERYCKQAEGHGKTMGYSTFCRAYNEYKQNLPASMQDVSMAFEWMPGKVAMIDYSGDPLYFTTSDGKRHKAEIFVAVMPYSNFTFCFATPDQTRQSWLVACKEMLAFFGAVPEYVFLDNSTSLVTKADLFDPQYCADFRGFAAYYDFAPMATRPGKPRDKAAVEGAVGIVQQRITNVLSPSQFLSLEDVNRGISLLLQDLNNRPLSEKSGTRKEIFVAEEKPVMQALPEIPYELGMIEKTLKVRKDYQVRVHNRRFSVPYTYAGKEVKVRLWQQKNVLVVYDLQNGKEIARHHYDGSGKILHIQREHMPLNHLMQLRTKEDLLNHLRCVGPHAYELGCLIKRNLRELNARKILNGMLAVAKNSGHALAEDVATAVLKRPEPTYQAYRLEIDHRIGRDDIEIALGRGVTLSAHRNPKHIRGSEYYEKRLGNKRKDEGE